MVFEPGATSPACVWKMSRTADAATGLAREAGVLRDLHRISGGRLAGAPLVHSAQWVQQAFIVREGAMAGRQLCEFRADHEYAELSMKASVWAAGLAKHTIRRQSGKETLRKVERFISTFADRFRGTFTADDIEGSSAMLEGLRDIPTACEHRDFSPWNVLVDSSGELAVLDWESTEPDGFAGPDVVYLLTHMAFFRDSAFLTGRYTESYLSMLTEDTFTGKVFRGCMSRYARLVGLPSAAEPAVRLLTWMTHAESEYRRAAADGDLSPDRLKKGVFYQLWRAELAHSKVAGQTEAFQCPSQK
jgi:hypothetical protein